MEIVKLEKFDAMSKEQMKQIEGGYKWYVECHKWSNGETWHCAYRINRKNEKIYGTPVVD